MKLTLLSTALAAILALASSAQAQTTATAPAATTTATTSTTTTKSSMAKMSYGGTVTAVDASANTLEVKSKKHDLKLMVNASTTYKGATALSGIAVGDKVRGSYMKDASGAMTAASVNKK